jgi:hypothetical protein
MAKCCANSTTKRYRVMAAQHYHWHMVRTSHCIYLRSCLSVRRYAGCISCDCHNYTCTASLLTYFFYVSRSIYTTILHTSYDRQALVKCLNALLPQTKVRGHYTTPDTAWQPQASPTDATGIHRALELARTKVIINADTILSLYVCSTYSSMCSSRSAQKHHMRLVLLSRTCYKISMPCALFDLAKLTLASHSALCAL